jgi:hypothetical protein
MVSVAPFSKVRLTSILQEPLPFMEMAFPEERSDGGTPFTSQFSSMLQLPEPVKVYVVEKVLAASVMKTMATANLCVIEFFMIF